MKKLLSLTILIFILIFTHPIFTLAQGMMEGNQTLSQTDDGHTVREEAEGKKIWGKLQTKELICEDLTDEKFGALGEYFMGQMMGDFHEVMNNMMIQMMGEESEEEIHIVFGKRISGCEPNATVSQNIINNDMMGSWSNSSAFNNFNNPMSMMNFGFTPFGWIFMILFWALIIVGIIALIKWIFNQNKI